MNTSSVLDRLIHRALPFLVLFGVLLLLRLSGAGVDATGPQSTTIALGFMLIAAFVGGKVAVRARLPRISGYLLVGMVLGPHVSNLLTGDMLQATKTIEGVAVTLIALTAGGEIRTTWLRQKARILATLTSLQLLFVGVSITAVVYFGRSLFPFIPNDDLTLAGIIAVCLAAIAISNSPTVTIAVIAENRATGPLSRTVLGVTVLVDVCVIVLFAVTLGFARETLGAGAGPSLALTLLRDIGGSIVAGILCGVGIGFFLEFVNRDVPVFVLALCFGIAQVAEMAHLEALLVALTAGFWVENFSSARGEQLIEAIERVSLPVFALFFAAAGAKVHLGALAAMGPLALLLSSVRGVGIWLATRVGSAISPVEPVVARYAWMGLISQAGVTLALAAILGRAFPEWGDDIQVLIIAMIALHELIGPIGFQHALRRAGEIGQVPRSSQTPPPPAPPADVPASSSGP
ncbi:MAG: hypothetical protein GX607_07125 [Myxococcales bacterium]|jgi:Kef-type K+ transport system membrane component KefB|nr:hypothetical protein [Myxococcales bacterium]